MSEIQIRLPDGKTLTMPAGSTLLDVAAKIGPGLARAALAGRIDGELTDLRVPIESDAAIEIVTDKDPQGAEIIRHSAEHVMADAVKRLHPDVQIDVGRTDHSEKFQYDFLVPRPFTPDDLEQINWGELRLRLSCDSGTATWDGTLAGFGSGTIDLNKLSTISGLNCLP